VIFVPEWPKREFVSFIGFILLTKSLSCNVVVLNRVTVLFRISSLSEFISLRWKEPYYDKFSVTSIKKAIAEVPGRFCAVDNSAKVRSLVSIRTV